MQLVDDAKHAWRWVSMRCMGAAVALLGAWEVMPDDLKVGVPHKVVTYFALALLGLGMAGRLVKQEKKK